MPILKNCLTCGKEFSVPPSKADKVFSCSHSCKTARSQVELTCKHCGKKFSEFKSQLSAVGAGTYCSMRCRVAAKAAVPKIPKGVKEVVIKECVVCGKNFRVPPSRANTAKACSNKCAYVVRGRSNKKQVDVACRSCGKVFSAPESHSKRRIYCSIECREGSEETKAIKSFRMAGDKNPRFCGSTTEHVSANGRKYRRLSLDRELAHGSNRRARKIQATPKWADLKAIEAIYREAQMMSNKTGIKHHVDHVIPLNSKKVCGLHVAENLQVIPAEKNLSKGNKLLID